MPEKVGHHVPIPVLLDDFGLLEIFHLYSVRFQPLQKNVIRLDANPRTQNNVHNAMGFLFQAQELSDVSVVPAHLLAE
jgi:hypothetical protein